jgi:hypothetical protein
MAQKEIAGHYGVWGIYGPPGRPWVSDLGALKELQDVRFGKGAVPTKQDMVERIAKLKAAAKAAERRKERLGCGHDHQGSVP